MQLIFFCENRNGVRIAAELIKSGLNEGVFLSRPVILTCDWNTDVSIWVSDEYDRRRLSEVADLRNLAEEEAHPIDDVQRDQQISKLVRTFLETNNCDGGVLFNDRSVRGSRVADEWKAQDLPFFLVQDGHLSFLYKSETEAQKDQNFFYGASRPSRVFVWGNSMRSQISARCNYPIESVITVGAFGVSDSERFVRNVQRPPEARLGHQTKSMRVLLADQPLVDQRKMTAADWNREATRLSETLKTFDLSVKPHPSSSPQHLASLETKFPNARILTGNSLLAGSELDGFDVVVTYFSSIYTECISAGKPVVFLSLEGCNTVFPEVTHPLVANVYSSNDLFDVLFYYQLTGDFRFNTGYSPIEAYVQVGVEPAVEVLNGIEAFFSETEKHVSAHREEMKPSPPVVQSYPASPGEFLERMFLTDISPRNIVVIGDDLGEKTGVAIPIRSYIKYALLNARTKINVIHAGVTYSADEIVRLVGHSRFVIINSLAFFWRRGYAADVVNMLLTRGVAVYVYAHETAYTFHASAAAQPDRHQRLIQLSSKLRTLCVSEAQGVFLRQYGFVNSAVVYNCIPDDQILSRSDSEPGGTKICMLGTVQARKGAVLFSRVADLAADLGLDWEFSWVGHRTRGHEELYFSPNVRWLGGRSRSAAQEVLLSSDIFFLPSEDDPMPLSVVEAIRAKRRIVTYSHVGSYEILHDISGYQPFFSYTANSALNSLMKVLESPVDKDKYEKLALSFSPRCFAVRMNAAIQALRNIATAGVSDRDSPVVPSLEHKRPDLVSMAGLRKLIQQKNYGAAVLMARELIKRRLTAGDYLECGEFLRTQQSFEESAHAFLLAAAYEPARAIGWLKLAELYDSLGDAVLAEIYARRAVEINPRSKAGLALVRKHSEESSRIPMDSGEKG